VTVPRLVEISEYWLVVPPMHEVVASFLGAEHEVGRCADVRHHRYRPMRPIELDALMKDLAGMGFTMPAGIDG
jgi:hypothetical protein